MIVMGGFMILGTGSYDTVKSGNRVSISGDGGLLKEFSGPSYKRLAPKWDTYKEYVDNIKMGNLSNREMIEDQYIKSYYETRLKNLDIDFLFHTLEEKYGRDIILLCYEEIDKFCHRRVLADYIELMTGIYIPEVEVDNRGKVKELKPIRYTNRIKEIIK